MLAQVLAHSPFSSLGILVMSKSKQLQSNINLWPMVSSKRAHDTISLSPHRLGVRFILIPFVMAQDLVQKVSHKVFLGFV